MYLSPPLDETLSSVFTSAKLVKRVLRYLRRTLDLGFFFTKRSETPQTMRLFVTGMKDSIFAGCIDSRNSRGGNTFLSPESLIAWKSNKQRMSLLLSVKLSWMYKGWYHLSVSHQKRDLHKREEGKMKNVELSSFSRTRRTPTGTETT